MSGVLGLVLGQAVPTSVSTTAAAGAASSGWEPGDYIAVGALLLSAFTIWLNVWHDRRSREGDRSDQRQREASNALGPVLGPMYLAVYGGPDFVGRVAVIRGRWESEARPAVMAIAAGYPSAAERDLATGLAVAVTYAVAMVGMWAERHETGADDRAGYREQAEDAVAKAEALWHRLTAAVRGDAAGDPPPPQPAEGTLA